MSTSFDTPIPVSEIEAVLAWVDTFKLSRPNKKIHRDFSDAVLLAEILAKHYPKLVEMHNYPPRNSHSLKLNNWMTLNRKVLKKLKLNLCCNTMEQLANCTPGVIERVLVMVRDKIRRDEDQAKHMKDAEQGMSSGGSYYEACGDDDNVLVVPVKTRVNGVLETIQQKVINHESYLAVKQELKDAKDSTDILKQKLEHLENMMKLKDERIEELQKQLDRKQSRRKEVEALQNSLYVPYENSSAPINVPETYVTPTDFTAPTSVHPIRPTESAHSVHSTHSEGKIFVQEQKLPTPPNEEPFVMPYVIPDSAGKQVVDEMQSKIFSFKEEPVVLDSQPKTFSRTSMIPSLQSKTLSKADMFPNAQSKSILKADLMSNPQLVAVVRADMISDSQPMIPDTKSLTDTISKISKVDSVPEKLSRMSMSGDRTPESLSRSLYTTEAVSDTRSKSILKYDLMSEVKSKSISRCDLMPEAKSKSMLRGDVMPEAKSKSIFRGDVMPEATSKSIFRGELLQEAKSKSILRGDLMPETKSKSILRYDLTPEVNSASFHNEMLIPESRSKTLSMRAEMFNTLSKPSLTQVSVTKLNDDLLINVDKVKSDVFKEAEVNDHRDYDINEEEFKDSVQDALVTIEDSIQKEIREISSRNANGN